jgi:hypothetical protein
MTQIKDAYEAGRRAVNKNQKPRLFTLMAVGTVIIVILAPYLHATTFQTVMALLLWLLMIGAWGYWRSKRQLGSFQ